jgi:hypothetical protein
MEVSYFDIDDILSECETLPCVFIVDAIDLGYLNSTDEDELDITNETKVRLPYWLCSPLVTRAFVRLIADDEGWPYPFKKMLCSEIVADSLFNFYKNYPYFYQLAMKIAELVQTPPIFLDTIGRILTLRFHHMVKRAPTETFLSSSSLSRVDIRLLKSSKLVSQCLVGPGRGEETDFLSKLDEFERVVYESKLRGLADYVRFTKKENSLINITPISALLTSLHSTKTKITSNKQRRTFNDENDAQAANRMHPVTTQTSFKRARVV